MKLTDRMVADWRDWHRWWSSRLAIAAGALVALVVAAPETALGVLNALPPETRAAISPTVGLVVFGAAMFTRLWKQRPKAGDAPPVKSDDD